MKTHLQQRRDDWEAATDEEVVDALLNRPDFIDPFWYNHVRETRPHCLRRALLLHRDLGGYLGKPALRWLQEHQDGEGLLGLSQVAG